MKPLVCLYAGQSAPYAADSVFDGASALDRAFSWAAEFCGGLPVFVATSPALKKAVEHAADRAGLALLQAEARGWTCSAMLGALSEAASNAKADTVLFAHASCPFIDAELTRSLLDSHERYLAEYTFADGYPHGFSPEVISSGAVGILASLAKDRFKEEGNLPVGHESIYNIMKGDINSFEVETVIAPADWRQLRLDFSCDTKAGFLSCKALFGSATKAGVPFTAQALSELASHTASVQQTVPAFYQVQIARAVHHVALYSPYPSEYQKRHGVLPLCTEKLPGSDMSPSDFASLVSQIAELSEYAVVAVGGWTEPLAVPDFAAYASSVLEHPGLSLLVETDGICLTEELALKLSGLSSAAKPRENGRPAIMWIVSLDAATQARYDAIYSCAQNTGGTTDFQKAVAAVSLLSPLFPGAVYPQFVRMHENEDELEAFYRYWHEKDSPSGGNLIIQKYDSYCGLLPCRKPADLSPLVRNPCWHIKRDMTILCDGSVPLCREQVLEADCGSVFRDGLSAVWERFRSPLEAHLQKNYNQRCGNCDEYYTFNF